MCARAPLRGTAGCASIVAWAVGGGPWGPRRRGDHVDVQASRKSKTNAARYRAVLEDQTEIISRFKADGTLLFVNAVYRRMFGMQGRRLVGRRWQNNAAPEDVARIEQELRTLSPGEPVRVIENRVRTPGGDLRWMQFVNRGFFSARGRLLEIQSVGRDITARVYAEQALRDSEQRLQLVLEATGAALWDWDLATGMAYLSPRYYAMTEYAPNEITPDLDFFKRLVHPADLPRVLNTMENHLLGKTAASVLEYRMVTRSGRVRWVLGAGRVVARDPAGAPLRMVGTVTDIDDRKNAEEDARCTRQQLALMDQALRLGMIGATLAHEINQPLSGILSNAQAALRQLPASRARGTEIREILQDIVIDAKRAGGVVTSVRRQLRAAKAPFAPVDPNALVRATVALAQSEGLLPHVTVDLQLEDGMPPVLGNRMQLQQLILNLVQNAQQAMASLPPRRRQLLIRSHRATPRMVALVVEDHGPGIPAHRREQIFELFYTTRRRGTGLGLAIGRRLATDHGGHLWAEPRPGGGTCMNLVLPIAATGTTRNRRRSTRRASPPTSGDRHP